jgi:hypothetical protein
MSAPVDGRKSPVDTVLPQVIESAIMSFNVIKEIPIYNNNQFEKSIQSKWFDWISQQYSFDEDPMVKLEKLDNEFFKQLDVILAEVKNEMKGVYEKDKHKKIDSIRKDLLTRELLMDDPILAKKTDQGYRGYFRAIGISFLYRLKRAEGNEIQRIKDIEEGRPKITYTDEFIPIDKEGNPIGGVSCKRKSPLTTGGKRKKRRTKKKRRKRNLKKRTRRRRRKSKRRRRR